MEGGHESMMDLDAVDLGGVQCDTCGSSQFYNEMGFYYCTVCNTQSQEVREIIAEDQFREGPQANTTVAMLREQIRKQKRGKDVRLSRYEVYNYVLREVLKKLVEIGFPSTVKGKAFQLWMAYLKRRGVIRVLNKNKTEEEKYLVSLRPDEGSIRRFYDYVPPPISNFRRRVYGSYRSGKEADIHFRKKKELSLKMNSSEWQEDEYGNQLVSSRQAKRQRTITKRKAMEEEYRSQLADKDDADIFTNSMQVDVDPSIVASSQPVSSQKPKKLKLLRSRAKKLLYKAINITNKEKARCKLMPSKATEKDILRPESFTLKTLYALVFIALREVGCNVIYTDLLRMNFDGTLMLKSITHFFSEEEQAEIHGSCDGLIRLGMTTDLFFYAKIVEDLILYLGIKEFRYPTVNEILPKFIEDLSLPLEFEYFVKEIDRLIPWEKLREACYISDVYFQFRPVMEIHTVILILVALKLLFGLDDVTERYHSQFARTVNSTLDSARKRLPGLVVENDFMKLFVVEDWIHHLRHKREIVKAELYSEDVCSTYQHPSVTRIHNFGKVFGCHKVEFDMASNTAKLNAAKLRDLFRGFANKNDEDGEEAFSAPIYCAPSLAQEDIAKTFTRFYPKVNEPSFSTEPLKKNFTKTRIDFVYNPEKYRLLLQKASYEIKIVSGHALPSNVPKDSHTLPVYQPYVKFNNDLWMPESVSKSMQFLIKTCVGMLVLNRIKSGKVQSILEKYVYEVARDLGQRHNFGFIPVEPYSDSDTEAEEMDEAERKRIDKLHGKDRAPIPLYDLEEEKEPVAEEGLPRAVIEQAAANVRLAINRMKYSEDVRREQAINIILKTLMKAVGTFDENEVFEESSSDGEIIDDGYVPRPKKRKKSKDASVDADIIRRDILQDGGQSVDKSQQMDFGIGSRIDDEGQSADEGRQMDLGIGSHSDDVSVPRPKKRQTKKKANADGNQQMDLRIGSHSDDGSFPRPKKRQTKKKANADGNQQMDLRIGSRSDDDSVPRPKKRQTKKKAIDRTGTVITHVASWYRGETGSGNILIEGCVPRKKQATRKKKARSDADGADKSRQEIPCTDQSGAANEFQQMDFGIGNLVIQREGQPPPQIIAIAAPTTTTTGTSMEFGGLEPLKVEVIGGAPTATAGDETSDFFMEYLRITEELGVEVDAEMELLNSSVTQAVLNQHELNQHNETKREVTTPHEGIPISESDSKQTDLNYSELLDI